MNDPVTPSQASRLTLRQRVHQMPRRNKIFLFGGVGLIILLIVLALIYSYWYQNPKKVVSDGIMNALNAQSVAYKGSYVAKAGSDITVEFNGGAAIKGGNADLKLTIVSLGKKYTLDGSGLLNDKGDIYFKVKNIDELVQNYRKAVPATSQPLFDKIVAKINDKWIKISSEDLKSYSLEVATAQRCIGETFKKAQGDSKLKSEVVDIYKKYPFIVIDKSLGSKDGSLGYLMNIDQTKAHSFSIAFQKTTIYKILRACDKNFSLNVGESASGQKMNQNTPVELWVNNWTHHITKIVASDKQKTTSLTVVPRFNQPVNVVTPTDATTLEQLQKDVQELLLSAATL
ncbi:MAG TPA: hypothetical protein VF281_00830 [Candidatus Saccharimonadales bacterium]